MKASEFASILRQVIREEVKMAIKEELKPIKALLAEQKKPIQKTAPTQLPKPAPRRSAPIVSFDGPLGSILNETAQTMYREPAEDWPDMNGGAFTADDAHSFGAASLSSMLGQEDALPATSYGSDPTMAFMKDYSAVLKAADQHAGGRF
jgi:hypothetical protein